MKIVLDSNILIAAFSSRGLCTSVFELCLDRHTVVISSLILSEVSRILRHKFKIPFRKVSAILAYLKEFCVVMSYDKLPGRICRHSVDDEILALAIGNGAEYIITGDKDLLDLKKYHSVRIVSPREFWAIAKAGN